MGESNVYSGTLHSICPERFSQIMTPRFVVPLKRLCVLAFALMSASLLAQGKSDIAGNWQGTLQLGKGLRTIVQVAKAEKGYTGKLYSIDQSAQGIPLSTVTQDGSTVKYAVEQIGVTYTGTLSADGNSIVGTFSQGGTEAPFTLVRSTKETAWEIPAPPPPVKRMAADANPSFDVATIKPADPAANEHAVSGHSRAQLRDQSLVAWVT